MKKEVILIGGGGHAESIIDSIHTLEEYEIIGILDNYKKTGETVLGIKIIGTDMDLEELCQKGLKYAIIAIGSIGNTETRRGIYELCKRTGYELPNIIDKSSIVSQTVHMGNGNFIGKGAVINSGAVIGNGCIINTGAIIEHGCTIGDFAHIAPGSVLCGNVSIQENAHIGAHSTIIQNVTIGYDTIIGAGSLVLKNIAPRQLAYGSPAKEVRSHE
ncbi:MAG: acetyltransferase [Lacrimispora sp.]